MNGIERLKEKSRRKPCIKDRVAPEIENALIMMVCEYPAYGQLRASNELRKVGILVSSGGVRSIWLRHGVETFIEGKKIYNDKNLEQRLTA